MKKLTLMVVAIALSAFQTAHAGTACDQMPKASDRMYCQQQVHFQADVALNKTYKKLQAKLNPAGKKMLKQSENGWIKVRDSRCEEPADTGYTVNIDCLTHETNLRTHFLNDRLVECNSRMGCMNSRLADTGESNEDRD